MPHLVLNALPGRPFRAENGVVVARRCRCSLVPSGRPLVGHGELRFGPFSVASSTRTRFVTVPAAPAGNHFRLLVITVRRKPMLEETQDEQEIIARVAALDIGKAELVCCVRVPDPKGGSRRVQEVTTYSTMTRSLQVMADRLMDLGVIRVVMEAGGCDPCLGRWRWSTKRVRPGSAWPGHVRPRGSGVRSRPRRRSSAPLATGSRRMPETRCIWPSSCVWTRSSQ